MNAQIIRGQSYEAYAASAGLRSSDFKRFVVGGPEVYEDEVLLGAEDEDGEAESKSKAFGKLVHAVFLEGASFAAEPEGFAWIKGDLRRAPRECLVECPSELLGSGQTFSTKRSQAFRDEHAADGKVACIPANYQRLMLWHDWKEQHAGAMLVSQDDAEALRRIRERIMRDPRARALIFPEREGAETEISLYWEADGVEKKARIDRLFPFLYIDVKTTRNVLPGGWADDAWKYRYDLSAVWYQEGIQACLGKTLDVEFIVIENVRPYRVRVHKMAPHWLAAAREEMKNELMRLRECQRSGVWEAEDAHRVFELQPPRRAKYQREYQNGE